MYVCIVHFDNTTEAELLKLLNFNIIHSKVLCSDRVFLKTRKLWKFFWFNHHFKNFHREYSYYVFSKPFKSILIPFFVYKKLSYNIEFFDGYTKKLSIYFSNINDIWKIKLFVFLKNLKNQD